MWWEREYHCENANPIHITLISISLSNVSFNAAELSSINSLNHVTDNATERRWHTRSQHGRMLLNSIRVDCSTHINKTIY